MNKAAAAAPTLDVRDIHAMLPHRYPFLLVDRVIDYTVGERLRAIKNVTINEPFFQGHFPGQPVFPGVLLIEGMAQTAGALCVWAGLTGKAKSVYFLTIDKCKFRNPVGPGDVIEYHMTKKAQRKNMWWYYGKAMVAGKVVAEAEVGAMIIEA